MNQILKHEIYGKGNKYQVEFMAKLGGMNEEETLLFEMLHEQKPDAYIQDALHIDRKAYNYIESAVRAKLLLAVFDCINTKMDLMD